MKIQITSIFSILIFQSILSFAQPGTLDSDFGNDGTAVFDVEQLDEGRAIAIQPDGKILITGRLGGSFSSEKIGVVRLNENGTLDSTFANNGYWSNSSLGLEGTAIDIALQSDGKILLLANAVEIGQRKTVLMRIDANGRRDNGFGTIEMAEGGTGMALQSDGGIIVSYLSDTEINLVRISELGREDSSFGDGGIASVNMFDVGAFRGDIAIQKDDKIVVTTGILDNDTDIFLARFDDDGELDTRFGDAGRSRTDIAFRDEFGRSLVIDTDGKILVGGGTDTFFGGRDFSIVRYDSYGDIDFSFGSFGVVTTDFNRGSETNHSITLQEDGKIIAAGFIGVRPNHDFALVRYDADGSIDQSFGDDGKVITDFGADDLGYVVTIQPDNKILALGHTLTNTTRGDFAVARYFSGLETVNINEREIEQQITVFPNPATEEVNIFSKNPIEKVVVFDSTGKMVLETTGAKVRTASLRPGLYYLQIFTEGFLVRKPILKL